MNKSIIFTAHILACVVISIFASGAHSQLPVKSAGETGFNYEINLAANYAARLMETEKIPGAAFFIINEGSVIYKSALGYSNIKKSVKFDFNKTAFAAGSLSKIFTSLAVLKMSQAGCFDLKDPFIKHVAHTSVNAEVNIESLLTHSSGFENCSKLYIEDGSEPQTLKKFTKLHMPGFTAKNIGEKFAYSNYNYALLGVLIEEISKIDFYEYIKNNIFEPLNMVHSSFNIKDKIEKKNFTSGEIEICAGYDINRSGYVECKIKNHNMPPASALITTAGDIAVLASQFFEKEDKMDKKNYIIDNKLLKEIFKNRIAVKNAAILDAYPPIDIMTCMFRHSIISKTDVYFHTGSIRGFSCGLYIIPEKKFAFFIACNSSNTQFRQKLTHFVFDQFLK